MGEDQEMLETPGLRKRPCTADFGQSIFKSSLKSFRLNLLFKGQRGGT